MPTKFIAPMTASAPAAVVSEMPWSMECGTKCTPMMPLDDAPQIKKLPDNNQNSGVRTARERMPPRRGPASATAVPGSGAGLASTAGSSTSP